MSSSRGWITDSVPATDTNNNIIPVGGTLGITGNLDVTGSSVLRNGLTVYTPTGNGQITIDSPPATTPTTEQYAIAVNGTKRASFEYNAVSDIASINHLGLNPATDIVRIQISGTPVATWWSGGFPQVYKFFSIHRDEYAFITGDVNTAGLATASIYGQGLSSPFVSHFRAVAIGTVTSGAPAESATYLTEGSITCFAGVVVVQTPSVQIKSPPAGGTFAAAGTGLLPVAAGALIFFNVTGGAALANYQWRLFLQWGTI